MGSGLYLVYLGGIKRALVLWGGSMEARRSWISAKKLPPCHGPYATLWQLFLVARWYLWLECVFRRIACRWWWRRPSEAVTPHDGGGGGPRALVRLTRAASRCTMMACSGNLTRRPGDRRQIAARPAACMPAVYGGSPGAFCRTKRDAMNKKIWAVFYGWSRLFFLGQVPYGGCFMAVWNPRCNIFMFSKGTHRLRLFKCKHAHVDLRTHLVFVRCDSHRRPATFCFTSEVYVYSLPRAGRYLWWALPRFRAAIFPDVHYRNWAGKGAPRWQELLSKCGVGPDEIMRSKRSAIELARAKKTSPSAASPEDFALSTVAALTMCCYWSRATSDTKQSERVNTAEHPASMIVDTILERFVGGISFDVHIRPPWVLSVHNGFVQPGALRDMGLATLVQRGSSTSQQGMLSLHVLLQLLLEVVLRPSRTRSVCNDTASLVFRAICNVTSDIVDASRCDTWLTSAPCLQLVPIKMAERCRPLSGAFREAVVRSSYADPSLGGKRSILSNLKNRGCGSVDVSLSTSSALSKDSMLKFFVDQRQAHAGIRALHLSMDGLQVGHDATDVAFAYSPELELGSVPPPQVFLLVGFPL